MNALEFVKASFSHANACMDSPNLVSSIKLGAHFKKLEFRIKPAFAGDWTNDLELCGQTSTFTTVLSASFACIKRGPHLNLGLFEIYWQPCTFSALFFFFLKFCINGQAIPLMYRLMGNNDMLVLNSWSLPWKCLLEWWWSRSICFDLLFY